MKISTILYSTIAIIIAPTSYMIGLFYHQGILNAYGVDSGYFPLSIPNYYINAFYFIYYKTTYITIWLIEKFSFIIKNIHWVVLVVAVLILALAQIFRRTKNIKISSIKFNKLIDSITNSYEIEITKILAHILSPIFTIGYFIFVFMLLLCLLPYWAYQTGYDNSFADLARFNKVGCIEKSKMNFNNCINYFDSDSNINVTGLLIEVGDNNIAIYDGIKSHIFHLSQKYKIEHLSTKKPI
ncbi:hypothetical protein [Tolumonas lignilytica]|uniref:hypothetical protein n=1 Tax=Tolumonas lignilytica TaxID=1283284 RepID=UPI0004636157|nr:hypothetical protein [Tolumonas lignilytica]